MTQFNSIMNKCLKSVEASLMTTRWPVMIDWWLFDVRPVFSTPWNERREDLVRSWDELSWAHPPHQNTQFTIYSEKQDTGNILYWYSCLKSSRSCVWYYIYCVLLVNTSVISDPINLNCPAHHSAEPGKCFVIKLMSSQLTSEQWTVNSDQWTVNSEGNIYLSPGGGGQPGEGGWESFIMLV